MFADGWGSRDDRLQAIVLVDYGVPLPAAKVQVGGYEPESSTSFLLAPHFLPSTRNCDPLRASPEVLGIGECLQPAGDLLIIDSTDWQDARVKKMHHGLRPSVKFRAPFQIFECLHCRRVTGKGSSFEGDKS